VPFLKKVVVGEDDDAVAHLVSAMLGDAGYLCLRARDGVQAVAMVRAESPDLLILDVLMPKQDGIQTVQQLKADPLLSRVPVLMLTALSDVDDRVRGLDAGADDYLAKPFEMRELQARVRALVRHNRRERDRSPTTGLPGPNALDEAIAARLERGERFGLVFIELDGFDAHLNDRGWKAVEGLLGSVGSALGAAAEGALLVHLGGDDFAAVAPGPGAVKIAEGLRQAGDAQLRQLASGLHCEITVVDSAGARNPEELEQAVAQARAQRR
jgi:DNA-binding response OmpR family regulator